MKAPSLRRRLIAYLLGVFVVAWLIMALVTYEETSHEVEELFDAQLAQVAGLFAERAPEVGDATTRHAPTVLSQGVYGHKYERLVGFQIWQEGVLAMRSQSAPETPLADGDGYNDQVVAGERWRVFGFMPAPGRRVLAGESYAVRDELVHNIALAALLSPFWTLPILAVLVWLAVGRALAPLRRVGSEVAGRDPRRLEPIPSSDAPREVEALVDALNALLARLHEAFVRERQFTADAAHELRTPLAGLKVQAQAALAAHDGQTHDAALQGVVSGVDRATRLVEQLLVLARVDPAVAVAGETEVELVDLAEEVVSDLFSLARQRGIELVLEVPEDGESPRVRGDRDGLYSLLRNLVDNALRHAPGGSVVRVVVDDPEGSPTLAVVDRGPGIPEQERERVFRRFYRGANERGIAGAGLGLAIVQRLAELHRAEVVLDDGPEGRGLRVTVRFPAAR